MYHFIDPQTGNIDTAREEAYRNAISSAGRPFNTVEGTITFKDATTSDIDGSVLPTNSLTISKQCVDSDELMFGGVFTNILKISLFTDRPRYDFYEAIIELTYKIEVGTENDEPVYGEVPLGIFKVADAERPSDRVNLTAYDNMTLLDIPLGGLSLSGTPFDVLQQIEVNTGFELGFDLNFLMGFPNYDKLISASSNDGLQTYRDVVKEICQLLGCFAYADRNGKLMFKPFSLTPDLNLTTSDWYSCVPADYTCEYIGIAIKSRAGNYRKVDPNPFAYGLVMSIEDAPAWDYGTEGAQEEKTDALYGLLRQIQYTPCSIDMPSDPTFDCGDMLALLPRGGDPEEPDDYIHTIITSVDWKFHNGMSLESVGINPYLEGSGVAGSESNRLLSQAVERSKIQFINFTNSSEINISSTSEPEKVCEAIFRPTAVTDALFVGTILVDVTEISPVPYETSTDTIEMEVKPYYEGAETVVTDINGNVVTFTGVTEKSYEYFRDGKAQVSIYYTLNNEKLPSDSEPYIAVDEIENGKHIITLSYPLNALEAYVEYTFRVWIITNAGEVSIPVRSVRATLLGQEIDDTSKFDGRIRVEDEEPFSLVNFGNVGTVALTHDEFVITEIEDPNVTPYEWKENQLAIIKALQIKDITELVSLYNISNVTVTSIREGTGELVPQISFQSLYLVAENEDNFATEDGILFITEGIGGEPT